MNSPRWTARIGTVVLAAALAVGGAPLMSATAAPTGAPPDAAPTYFPSGPQVNVPTATVTGGGWTPCYTDTYQTDLEAALPDLLASCTGESLMLAARPAGSDTIALLAAASRTDVLTDTGADNTDTTHTANGTAWYFNQHWSWGFAPAGESVDKSECDVTDGDLRMCWHTVNGAGGYRVGNHFTFGDDYERIVYQAAGATPQPQLQPQAINFTSTVPTDAVVGDTYAVSATGGASGNGVTFSIDSAATSVCSLEGTTVHLEHAGDCVVNANQAAASGYTAAPQVQQTVAVTKASQAITFTSTAPATSGPGGKYTVAAVGGASGNAVTLTVDPASAEVCTLDGSTVTLTHAGTCVVNANQAGDDDYLAAPQAQQSVNSSPTAQALAFSSAPPTDAVVGTGYKLGATGGKSGNPVEFSLDQGSGDVCALEGDDVTFAHPGTCTVHADQQGGGDFSDAPQATQQIAVAQATTAATVNVEARRVTATVTVVAPGAGTPTGTVTFSVGGTDIGSAPLEAGTATLAKAVPSGAARTVAARYDGDRDFTGSSASITRQDPQITAKVISARPASAAGWFRSPVTVSFKCTPGGAQLTGACPAPVTLNGNGAGQSVTRTIAATDGGTATVATTGINIDKVAPSVRVTGVRNGATYTSSVPTARCAATDSISGVASCRLTRHTTGNRTVWTATATDRAGNTRTTRSAYRTLPVYLDGAAYKNGVFTVRVGRTYTIVVKGSSVRPVYYDAAVVPRKPVKRDKAFRHAGRNRWTMGVTMNPAMRAHKSWHLGVKIGSKMRLVTIRVS